MRILFLLGLLGVCSVLFAAQAAVPSLREIPAMIEQLQKGTAEERLSAAKRITYRYCPDAVLPLINALSDEDIHVRIAAARAVAPYADPRAKKPLLALLAAPLQKYDGEYSAAKLAALRGLAELDDPAIVASILPFLKYTDAKILHAALFALRNYDDARKIRPYIEIVKKDLNLYIDDRYPDCYDLIFFGLRKCGKPAVDALWEQRENVRLQELLGKLLEESRDQRAKIFWREQLKDAKPIDKGEICLKLMKYDQVFAENALLVLSRSDDKYERHSAAKAFLNTKNIVLRTRAREMLFDEDIDICQCALMAVGSYADPNDLPAIINTYLRVDGDDIIGDEIFSNYSDEASMIIIAEELKKLDIDSLRCMLQLLEILQSFQNFPSRPYYQLPREMYDYLMGIIQDEKADEHLRADAVGYLSRFRDMRVVPTYIKLLRDKSPVVQERVAWAFGRRGLESPEALKEMAALLAEGNFAQGQRDSTDIYGPTDVRNAFIMSIIDSGETVKGLKPEAGDTNNYSLLISKLTKRDDEALALVLSAPNEMDSSARSTKFSYMKHFVQDERYTSVVIDAMIKGLKSEDPDVRFPAFSALNAMPYDKRFVDIALKAKQSSAENEAYGAISYLGKQMNAQENILPALLELAQNKRDRNTCHSVFSALCGSTDPRIIDTLISMIITAVQDNLESPF